MTSSISLMPSMMKPLRQARRYGFLIERAGAVYRFGADEPACSKALAEMMVQGGWLVKYGYRYEPTVRGLQAVADLRS